MSLSLYAKVSESARYCRDLEVRKKIFLFLEVIKSGKVEVSCKKFGIARRSYSRWWKRYELSGYEVSSLKLQSRRPHRSPFVKRRHEYNYDRPHSSLNGLTPTEKWAERFLTAFFGTALFKGIDLKTVLGKDQKRNFGMVADTYLKYLGWIQSDPFHGTDVLNYYTKL